MHRISTHVLDTSRGCPAAGITVDVCMWQDEGWQPIAQQTTDVDGRVANFLSASQVLHSTRYQLRFYLEAYFKAQQQAVFYPQVVIECQLQAEDEHYHIPLLLSPYGYSTYRGS